MVIGRPYSGQVCQCADLRAVGGLTRRCRVRESAGRERGGGEHEGGGVEDEHRGWAHERYEDAAERGREHAVGQVRLVGRGRSLSARFRLSEAAQVVVTVADRRTRRVVRGPLRRIRGAGAARISIRGRLRRGRYVLSVVATDGALNRSARIVPFRVRR